MDDIKNMNPEDLYKVNEEVYEFFDINRNNINKGYLLDKAVFDYKKNNNKLQYSTGHINIMFILGIILVLAFVIAVLTIFILMTSIMKMNMMNITSMMNMMIVGMSILIK